MTKIENQCVECGLPCIQTACPWTHVEVHYCDECQKSEADYKVGENEYCSSCVDKLLNEQLRNIFDYFIEIFRHKSVAVKSDILGVDLQKM